MSVTSDIFEVAQKANSEQYDILKVGIKGHAIPYQRHFLDMVDLSLKPSQKEYYVPDINFTWLFVTKLCSPKTQKSRHNEVGPDRQTDILYFLFSDAAVYDKAIVMGVFVVGFTFYLAIEHVFLKLLVIKLLVLNWPKHHVWMCLRWVNNDSFNSRKLICQ